MEDEFQEKVNKLSLEQRIIYERELMGICEFKDACVFYGAKDPINLPQEDYNAIRQNLYREMFESKDINSF